MPSVRPRALTIEGTTGKDTVYMPSSLASNPVGKPSAIDQSGGMEEVGHTVSRRQSDREHRYAQEHVCSVELH